MKLLLSGEGGQGIQTIAKIIANSAYNQKYHISYIPHYGVEMRMGISLAYLTIQSTPVNYPKFAKADILVALTARENEITSSFIAKNTRLINLIDSPLIKNHNLPYKTLNMLALGILIKELNTTDLRLDINNVKEEAQKALGEKANFEDNLQAFDLGLSVPPENYFKQISKSAKTNQPLVDRDEKKEFIRYPALCKGCGLCVEKCPKDALSWSGKEINFINRPLPKVDMEKCIACRICENICPDCAIQVNKFD